MGQPNRRKLFQPEVDSRALVRFVVPFGVLLIGSIVIVRVIQTILNDSLREGLTDTNLLQVLEKVTLAGGVGLLVLGLISVVFWLFSARRIFGPAVQFHRHVEELLQGNYKNRVRLRQGDEFQPLAENLNRLAEQLEKKHRGDAGVSLVELLIAIGIMGVVAVGTVSMFDSQRKQIRAVSQKQEMLDLKNVMLLQLSKPEVCTWQLKDKRLNVSGRTSPTQFSPTILNFSELRQGSTPASALFAQNGQLLPGTQVGLKVESLAFKNIYATGTPNEYRGVFEVAFASSTLQYAMQPVQISQVVRTVAGDPASNARIEACVSVGAANECTSLDPGRPWLKKMIICSTATGGKSVLTLSYFTPGGDAIYAAAHGRQPLTVLFRTETGTFVRSYDGPPADAQSCIGPNLKTIAADANNNCT